MSARTLVELHSAGAFAASPRREQMSALHFPFDDLVSRSGLGTVERNIDAELRRGSRVAMVGATGTGKSSIMSYVLGPAVEGLAPLYVPVSVEDPSVAQDPVAFLEHLLGHLRRLIRQGFPSREQAAENVVGRRRQHRLTLRTPAWMPGQLQYEMTQLAQDHARASTHVLDQLLQLLGLVGAHDLVPVLLFDDTDRWVGALEEEESRKLRAAFFGRVLRLLADDLGVAGVIAVHPAYEHDAAYQSAQAFFDHERRVPHLSAVSDVRALLQRRVARILGHDEEDGALDAVMTPEAVSVLFRAYQVAPDIRRRILLTSTAALTLAIGAGVEQIDEGHVRAALSEQGG